MTLHTKDILQGCNATYCGRSLSMFQRTLPWKWSKEDFISDIDTRLNGT